MDDPTSTIAGDLTPPEAELQANPLAVVPGTLADLSGRRREGLEVIEARAQIISTARRAAIKMTRPEDWLLFRDPQGREVGYLQDCGCDRVRDIFGIDVFDVSRPERLELATGDFMYVVTGSGRSRLTQQVVERIEGGRPSTDDFIMKANPPLEGAHKELSVRKAARANLDGNITRELSGLKSIPLIEILEILGYETRPRFREGRGYGGGRPDLPASGPARSENTAQAAPPLCPNCKVPMQYRPAAEKNGKSYSAFWGCPNFRSKGCKETLKDSDWQKQRAAHTPAPTQPPLASQEPTPSTSAVPPALLDLQKVLVYIATADKSLTANVICQEFFKTQEGKPLDYAAVAKLRTPGQLQWIADITGKIREKYANLLPPTEAPVPELAPDDAAGEYNPFDAN